MRLAIAFQRFGPYHAARLEAAAMRAEVVGIEYCRRDPIYSWRPVERVANVSTVVCVADGDIDELPAVEVRRYVHGVLTEASPDVVAVPGWSSPGAISTLDWCLRTKTPAVLMSDSSERDLERAAWKEWIKSRVVRLFSAALVAGRAHAEYAVKLGIPASRVFVGYDVVDNEYFATRADEARARAAQLRAQLRLPRRYFLASNRFIPEKNLDRLVDAYAAYARRSGEDAWHLMLVGDGELASGIADKVRSLRLTDQVHMPGFKQYEELSPYYALAGALVLASTKETWGLVVNEAMASGLPVLVSTHCGCAPDLVKEGVNGFTFDPFDVGALTDQLTRIAGGSCDLEAMGRASRDIIADWGLSLFARNIRAAADAARCVALGNVAAVDRALLWGMARR